MIRHVRAIMASTLAVFFLSSAGFAAQAQDPISIPPGKFLVDNSDVLTASEEESLAKSLKSLTKETGQSLYVVYVDEFSNPSDAQKWLGATADLKKLGSTDSMLVVATEQRSAQFESHSRGDIASYDSQIFSKYTKPKLSDTDWLGAGIATAQGVKDAANGKLAVATKPTSKNPPKSDAGSTSVTTYSSSSSSSFEGLGTMMLWIMGVLGLVVIVALYFTLGLHSRLMTRLNQPKLEELKRDAGSSLFKLNESVEKLKESSMFAMAQYGSGVTIKLDEDLSLITNELSRLFKVQKDSDDTSNTKKKIRSILNDILKSSETVSKKIEKYNLMLDGLAKEEENITSELESQKGNLSKSERTFESNSIKLNRAIDLYETEALSKISDDTKIQSAALENLRVAVNNFESKVTSGETAEAVGLSHISRDAQQRFNSSNGKVVASWENLYELDLMLKNLTSKISAGLVRSAELMRDGYRNQLESPSKTAISALELVSLGKFNPSVKIEELSSASNKFLSNLDKVEAEVAAINKARRELPVVMASARQYISSAEQYISRNRSDVSGNAVSILSAAKGQLEMAILNDTGRDLRPAYSHAQDSLNSAQRADRIARDDVDRAERQRRQAQMAAAAAITASHNHNNNLYSNSFSNNNNFGGGSSGFGSGGAGGNF